MAPQARRNAVQRGLDAHLAHLHLLQLRQHAGAIKEVDQSDHALRDAAALLLQRRQLLRLHLWRLHAQLKGRHLERLHLLRQHAGGRAACVCVCGCDQGGEGEGGRSRPGGGLRAQWRVTHGRNLLACCTAAGFAAAAAA